MRREVRDDIVFTLFLLPGLLAVGATLYFWSLEGLGAEGFSRALIALYKDPLLYLLGLIFVCGAILLDVKGPEAGPDTLRVEVDRLQVLGLAAFIMGFLVLWLGAAGGNLLVTVSLLLSARYALIFPATLIILSLLLSPDLRLGTLLRPEWPNLLLWATPLVLLATLKARLPAQAGYGLTALLLALWVLSLKRQPTR
jgi:hypothetical protein